MDLRVSLVYIILSKFKPIKQNRLRLSYDFYAILQNGIEASDFARKWANALTLIAFLLNHLLKKRVSPQ